MVGRAAGRQSLLVASRSFSARTVAQHSSSPTVLAPGASSPSPLPSLLANAALRLRGRPCPTSVSARYLTAASTAPPKITLFQYHICPFCNIGKALLAYSNTAYDVVEVNPLTKAELKPWSGEYRKVPIAVIDDDQVNGSEDIVDALLESPRVQRELAARWAEERGDAADDDDRAMTLPRFQKSDGARKWMRFARDDLAALLYPNICGSLGDSYAAFGYVERVASFTTWQKASVRYLGALAMYFAASKIKTKRGITDARASLHAALDKFEAEGLRDGTASYVSGASSPDMGDVAVFGVLSSVTGLTAHAEAIRSRGGHVEAWYDRMHLQVTRGGAPQ